MVRFGSVSLLGFGNVILIVSGLIILNWFVLVIEFVRSCVFLRILVVIM